MEYGQIGEYVPGAEGDQLMQEYHEGMAGGNLMGDVAVFPENPVVVPVQNEPWFGEEFWEPPPAARAGRRRRHINPHRVDRRQRYIPPQDERYRHWVVTDHQLRTSPGYWRELVITQPNPATWIQEGYAGMNGAILTVHTLVSNYGAHPLRGNQQGIESNLGVLVGLVYPKAFLLARRMHNTYVMGDLGDEVWVQEGIGPELIGEGYPGNPINYFPPGTPLDTTFDIENQRIQHPELLRPQNPSPVEGVTAQNYYRGDRNRVSVKIRGLPNQEVGKDITTRNVVIWPGFDSRTVSSLYKSLIEKYKLGLDVGTFGIGREEEFGYGSGNNWLHDLQQLGPSENIEIDFVFHLFQPRETWHRPHRATPFMYRYPVDPRAEPRRMYHENNEEPPDDYDHDFQAAVEMDRPMPDIQEPGPIPIQAPGFRGAVPPPAAVRNRARINRELRSLQIPPRTGAALRTRSMARRTRGNRPLHRAETAESKYAKMKSRIYVRRCLGDFFSYTRSAISVPHTEQGLCFPMAFMRCECRANTHRMVEDEVQNDIIDIREDYVFEIELDEGVEPPFQEQYSFYRDRKIRVFDTTKHKFPRVGPRGPTVYKNEAKDLDRAELEAWAWCAYQVHKYVEIYLEGEEGFENGIEIGNTDVCMPAYSYVFDVNIRMYTTEMRGQRLDFERVEGKRETDLFVNLLSQGAHLHAISHMRDYLKADSVDPTGTSIHNYCDYCETLAAKGRTRGRDGETRFPHQSECYPNEVWGTSINLQTMHRCEAAKLDQRTLFIPLAKDRCKGQYCSHCKFAWVGDEERECNCFNENTITSEFLVQCKLCTQKWPAKYVNQHICFMNPRKPKPRLPDEKIWVYDIETAQDYNEEINQSIHTCILICLRAVYDRTKRVRFDTIRDFVRYLLDTKDMWGTTILAHNGGGFDHQFVLRYLEDNNVKHTHIPRPGTIHKYLELKIENRGGETSIRFIDFMMMFGASLKKIGEDFNLDVCKGDFPHKFSRLENLDYEGPIPQILDETTPCTEGKEWDPKGYYSLHQMKSEKDREEAEKYWLSQYTKFCTCYDRECTCQKPKWNFKTELERYCWLDVDVLAEACRKYRDQALDFNGGSTTLGWSTEGIDPFQYLTQSQIALAMFTQGLKGQKIMISQEKIRPQFDPNQILWMEQLMEENYQYQIQHAGNSYREWYDLKSKTFVSGFCRNTRTAFEYLNCYHYGCRACFAEQINQGACHPVYQLKWEALAKRTEDRLQDLSTRYTVKHKWSHEDLNGRSYPDQDPQLGQLMKLRECFYGGRTEVFACYANPELMHNMELLHHDVCSLYPYVCSWKELPIGVPKVYFGKGIDKERLHPNHPNRFFGYARIRVKPNTKDFIAVLPLRTGKDGEEKLVYDLLEKEGCWHTELIYLAMERQYEVLEVYEVWDWEPDQRSSTIMRGYMEFFLRMKQESEGWKKLGAVIMRERGETEETLTEETKELIIDNIFELNGGFARLDPTMVAKKPVLRQLAKVREGSVYLCGHT